METNKLIEALEWYQEQAEAMNRYTTAEPANTTGQMALVISLSLDGGRRAKEALLSYKSSTDGQADKNKNSLSG